MLSVAWETGGSGGGGEIPATCENSQTQTITEGQPGYQEAEGDLEQDQVRGTHACRVSRLKPALKITRLLLERDQSSATVCCEGIQVMYMYSSGIRYDNEVRPLEWVGGGLGAWNQLLLVSIHRNSALSAY